MPQLNRDQYPLTAQFIDEHELAGVVDGDVVNDFRRVPRPTFELAGLDPVTDGGTKGGEYQWLMMDYADANFPEEVILARRVFYVMQQGNRLDFGYRLPGVGNQPLEVHSGKGRLDCVRDEYGAGEKIIHMLPAQPVVPLIWEQHFFSVQNMGESPLVISTFHHGDETPGINSGVLTFGPNDREINIAGGEIMIPDNFMPAVQRD